MSETGWLVQVPVKAKPGSSWEPPHGPVLDDLEQHLLRMGVTRTLVTSSPQGGKGEVVLDLDPERVGQEAGPERIFDIVDQALARMVSIGAVLAEVEVDGDVTMLWHIGHEE